MFTKLYNYLFGYEQDIKADSKQIGYRHNLLCEIKKYNDKIKSVLSPLFIIEDSETEEDEYVPFTDIHNIKYFNNNEYIGYHKFLYHELN
jgi:hypothetical protein